MSSDSAHQPLYLRASNVAQASDDDEFWLSLQEGMASCNASMPAADDGEQDAADDEERAPPPENDAFWLALQDRMNSRINEDATAAEGRGQEIDEHVFADLMGYPQKPAEGRQSEEMWLQGFASLDDTFAFAKQGEDVDKSVLPGLVSIPGSDSETEPETDSDDESFSSPFPSHPTAPARKGVSFSSTVEVKTVPHRSSLSPSQRRRMYNSSVEIHRNKIRNKKEFRYDGYDWRNATEECDMGVDEITGELVHPAHEYELSFDC